MEELQAGWAIACIPAEWPKDRIEDVRHSINEHLLSTTEACEEGILCSSKGKGPNPVQPTGKTCYVALRSGNAGPFEKLAGDATHGLHHNRSSSSDISYICFTSGTTATPKAVCGTMEALLTQSTYFTREFGYRNDSCMYQVYATR